VTATAVAAQPERGPRRGAYDFARRSSASAEGSAIQPSRAATAACSGGGGSQRPSAAARAISEVMSASSAWSLAQHVAQTRADAAPASGREAPSSGGLARAGGDPGAYDRVLFDALRALRRTLAEERGVPPYLVFSDASLRDMARLKPRTREALLEVKGVGEWKSETFGERFLGVIRQHA